MIMMNELALVQVAFYAIRPGNGLGLFYNGPRTHTGQIPDKNKSNEANTVKIKFSQF